MRAKRGAEAVGVIGIALFLSACSDEAPAVPVAPASTPDVAPHDVDDPPSVAEGSALTVTRIEDGPSDQLLVRGHVGQNPPFQLDLGGGITGSISGGVVDPSLVAAGPRLALDASLVGGAFTITSSGTLPDECLLVVTTHLLNDPVLVWCAPRGFAVDLGILPPRGSAPVVVGGRVVDPAGRPVADVLVQPRLRLPLGSSYHSSEWRVRTDAEGRFAFRAHAFDIESVSVDVEGEFRAGGAIEVAVGTTDVEFVVERTVEIRGRVLLPEGMTFDDLVLVLDGAGAGEESVATVPRAWKRRSAGRLEFRAGAEFSVAGLRAGTYDLRLRREGSVKPLAQVLALEVGTADIELPALEVAAASRTRRVRVLTAAGEPAVGARVWAKDVDSRGGFGAPSTTGEDGVVEIRREADVLEFMAHARGHRFATLTAAEDRLTISLVEAAASPVSIALPAEMEREHDRFELLIAVQWAAPLGANMAAYWPGDEDGDPRAGIKSAAPIPAQGSIETTLSEPGWYRMTVVAKSTTGGAIRRISQDAGRFRFEGGGKSTDAVSDFDPKSFRSLIDDPALGPR